MAKDVVELLDHIEWTGKRQLHIVGLSMGGMIAQELGFIENLRNRINLFIPRNLDRQLEMVKHNMFTPSWLLLPDGEGKFPTNGDRVAAQDLRKRMDHEAFTRKGFILQAIAAGWHHKSKEQLHELADNVGRKRILVMHGDQDRMITPPHGKVLRDELSTEQEEVQWKFVEEKGHVLPWEWRGGFTEMMEEFWGKTEGLDDHDGEEQPLAVSES
ncbi:MAG: hypothetical protein M1823_005820 [Watsoniomyces obsoletus]|nr:MAG: hypothetical protein M1823_005820 [Watsoniomyces obsoletus]